MKPWSKSNFVGIEIECYSSFIPSQVRKAIKDHGLSRYVREDGDSSIDVPEGTYHCQACYNGTASECQDSIRCGEPKFFDYEFKVLCPQRSAGVVLAKMKHLLKHIKARTNKSCGLHVHLDMRTRNVHESFSKLVLASPLLYKMNPYWRKTGNYSQPNVYETFQQELSRSMRGLGINPLAMNRHTTLEVRIHKGTLNTQDIYNWVKLLCHIVDGPALTKRVKSPEELNIPKPLVEYATSKMMRYHPPRKKVA